MKLKAFFRDWKLVLLSLVLAVALWVYADQQSTIDKLLTISFVLDTPEDVMSIPDKKNIRVKVIGTSRSIERIAANEDRLQVKYLPKNLPDAEQGESVEGIYVSGRDITLGIAKSLNQDSVDIEVASIKPEYFEIKLVRMATKELAVAPIITGKPAEGYEQDNIAVYPPRVMVSGPAKILKELMTIETEKIDISDRRKTFYVASVDLAKQIDDYPVETKETVTINIDIRRQIEPLKLASVEINVLAPEEYPYVPKLSKNRIDIALSGPKEIIKQIKAKPDIVNVFVDVSELKPRETPYELPLLVNLPKEVEITSKLDNIQVDVKEKAAEQGQ